MASSGSFQNAFATGYTLRVEWKVNSQNVAANTSNLTVTAYLVSGGSSYTVESTVSKTISLTIDGATYSKTAAGLASLSGNQKKELFSKTVTITHSSDGSKSVNISCAFAIDVTLSGTFYSTVRASGAAALDKIAKASTPTVSGSMGVGSTVTINTNRASTSFTHKLEWSIDQKNWSQIATGVGVSTTWTLPNSMATAKPASTSGVCYIRCTTYSGATNIGTSTVSYKYYITENYAKPVLNMTALQTNSANIEEYIRGKSVLTITANTTAKYGATPAKYIFTYGGVSKTVVSTKSTEALSIDLPANAAETYICTVQVIDTRGYTAEAQATLATIAYEEPKITTLKAVRGNYVGGVFTAADEGEDVQITLGAQISNVSDYNAKRYAIQYKLSTSTSYTSAGSAKTPESYNFSATEYIQDVISANSSYDIRVVVSDSFGSIFKVVEVPTAFTIIDFNASGRGISIGKVSEKNGFEVAMPMYDTLGMMYRNGLALYESAGATDANTTLEELFISQGTENNAPDGGFFFIRQMFYATKSEATNRAQYAIPYTAGGSHYRRNYNNGAWSDWYEIPIIVDKGTSGVWTYEKLSNGYAECWGKVSISNLAVTNALGNWYSSEVLDGTALPFTFAETPVFTMEFSTGSGTGAMVWLTGAGSSTVTPTLYLIRPTSAASVSGVLNIHVRGKWA